MSPYKPTAETIALVRRQLFCNIKDFADVETQTRRWLDYTDTNPYYTFSECMCHYFDEAVIDGDLDKMLDEGFITPAELAAIRPFHVIADGYQSPTEDYDYVTILSDPAWHRVQYEAMQCCARLLELIDDKDEAAELRITPRKQDEQAAS